MIVFHLSKTYGFTTVFPLICAHQFFFFHIVVHPQNPSTSVDPGQLFKKPHRPSVATAEVMERRKVQRGSVWRGLGDPSHVSLLMLSRGEADTRPTGVTASPPNPLSHCENGAETLSLLLLPAFLRSCGLLIYSAGSRGY